MRVRFTVPALVPGGPQFAAGEVTELSDSLAVRFLARGWATEAPVDTKDVSAAPQHRMVTGAVRKDYTGRGR